MAISQGKGANFDAAFASAIMESIEIYHAEHITLPVVFSCYEDIRYSEDVIDLEDLPMVRGRSFDTYQPSLWIKGQRLCDGKNLLVPFELVHTNYTRPLPPGSGFFLSSSNGLASGNSFSEAVCHAICELIERDAVSLWSQLPWEHREKKRVSLSTVHGNEIEKTIDRFEKAGVSLAIWDVSSDVGVPAFLAWSYESTSDGPVLLNRPAVGAGCHPNRDVALSRALTESAQERLTLITGSRDDLSRNDYSKMNFQELFSVEGEVNFSAIPSRNFSSSDEDVEWLVSRLETVGIRDLVVVDLTKEPAKGIVSIVRVIAPGLESVHYDTRYVPGKRARKQRLSGQ